MLVLNFSHPLTPDQIGQIETLTGEVVEDERRIPAQFDPGRSFRDQTSALADACNLTPEQWQTADIVIVPPSLNFIAVVLLAELHGRMGHFPATVRMRPVEGSLTPKYAVAEILPLQQIRDAARTLR